MPDSPVRTLGSTRDAIREFFAAERRNSEKIEKFNRGLTEEDELPPYVYQEYPKAMYPLGHPEEDAVLAKDLREEQRWIAEGYYPSLAEQQAAREAFETEIGQAEEPNEETAESVGTTQAPARGAGGRFQKKTA